MSCSCGPNCGCQDTPPAASPTGTQAHPGGDLVSGGTGMSMRRFKTQRTTAGAPEWGSLPEWTRFRRPLPNLDRQWDVVASPAPAVGFHVQRVYADATTGQAVSLMGEPCEQGAAFPTEDNLAGYGFYGAGRP